MTDFIKQLTSFFVIINTGILLVFGLSTLGVDSIPTNYIWNILLLSLLTALVTALVFSIDPRKPVSKAANALLMLGHYAIVAAIVFFFGMRLEWFSYSVKGLLSALVSVALVYGFTALVSNLLRNKESRELNDALKNFSDEEE